MTRVAGRIFSGIQPSGTLHLGNYLGAIKNWVQLQNDYEEVFYAIMDLHAMTTPRGYTRADMVARTRHVTATLLACGIEPERCTLFQQSQASPIRA
jgi:tryptophanyl-tRNA synthetase